jgi:RNA polymerase sigma factor (sigma-70 family)
MAENEDLQPEVSGEAQNQAAPTPENFTEDPLEQLLDEESDDEFGLPEFKEHFADELTPAVLKDWTAQDFASIYVRFRPHLERHARRFLNNPTQVEEVVQDAFLYLMTTLPELDSELGVLKFLKWKTRLLALDVIRANSRAYMAPIDDQPEMAADLPEMSLELERAEDAAIVRMALAKLPPRHREALIATIYEEKPTEVVASQLGLSENATRQLLFRARASFRKALIGEAETQGLSIGQILSLAARKAAQDAGKVAGAVGAFVLLVAIAIGVVPNLATQQQLTADAPAQTQSEPSSPAATGTPDSSAAENTQPAPADANPSAGSAESDSASASTGTQTPATSSPATETVSADPQEAVTTPALQVDPTPATQPATGSAPGNETSPTLQAPVEPQPTFSEASFSTILSTDVQSAGYYENSRASKFGELLRGYSIEVFGGTGISAFVSVNPATLDLDATMFQMWVDGNRYYAIAKTTSKAVTEDGQNRILRFTGSEFYVIDDQGRVFSESPLADATAVVTVKINQDGRPLNASIRISK